MADNILPQTDLATTRNGVEGKQSLFGPITTMEQLEGLNLSKVESAEVARILEKSGAVMLLQEEGRKGAIIIEGSTDIGIGHGYFVPKGFGVEVSDANPASNPVSNGETMIERSGLNPSLGVVIKTYPEGIHVDDAKKIIATIPKWAMDALKPQEKNNNVDLLPLTDAGDGRYTQIIRTQGQLETFLKEYGDKLSADEISAIRAGNIGGKLGEVSEFDEKDNYGYRARNDVSGNVLIITLHGKDTSNLTPSHLFAGRESADVIENNITLTTRLDLMTGGKPRPVTIDGGLEVTSRTANQPEATLEPDVAQKILKEVAKSEISKEESRLKEFENSMLSDPAATRLMKEYETAFNTSVGIREKIEGGLKIEQMVNDPQFSYQDGVLTSVTYRYEDKDGKYAEKTLDQSDPDFKKFSDAQITLEKSVLALKNELIESAKERGIDTNTPEFKSMTNSIYSRAMSGEFTAPIEEKSSNKTSMKAELPKIGGAEDFIARAVEKVAGMTSEALTSLGLRSGDAVASSKDPIGMPERFEAPALASRGLPAKSTGQAV